MAWRTESVMDQRVEFVLRAKEGEEAIAELCREYGISRPTGYLWLNRYQQVGSVTGLLERSRRPQHSPQRTATEIETAVLAVRDRTGWGGPKIAKVLARQGLQVAPATALIRAVTLSPHLRRGPVTCQARDWGGRSIATPDVSRRGALARG